MMLDVDGVKFDRAYHHGDLRSALIGAAEELLAERGVEHFSLRETARRAGVSPAAPKHHFPDVRMLLTAVAVRAFNDLTDRLEAASGDALGERTARIRAQGNAYVLFAIEQRARFDLMWREGMLNSENADLITAKQRTFAALDRLVRGDATTVLAHDDPASAASVACWSIVHGFARLTLDGSFGQDVDAASQVLNVLLPSVLDHLTV